MKTHDLKLSIEFCDAVLRGEKTFEVRKNDRGFQTGDLIRFIPTDGTSYRSSDGTIREHAKHEISGHTYKITYILNGWGIKNGYVVLGIKEYRQTEEVKHGDWLKPGNDPIDNKQWICSECKGLTETAYYCGHCYYNYCPNCGTRMDGVANG